MFIDDTGHEELRGDHKIFGLGGCAMLAQGLSDSVNIGWRAVRKVVNGDPSLPLHATKFSRNAPAEHIASVAAFFEKPTFFRLAVVVTVDTKHPQDMSLMEAMRYALQWRLQEIVDRASPDSIALIFEHSERAQGPIEKYISGLEITKDGSLLEIKYHWLSKSANEPAMEVADFIMHAVHSQMRRERSGKPGYNRDFQSVFTRVPLSLISYMHVDLLTGPEDGERIEGTVVGKSSS